MKTKPDLTNGYYAVRGSRDFYKGTSFRCNVWSENTHYFHDENYVDFVVYDGTLLMCMRNHISSEDNQPILKREGTVAVGLERNPLWEFVIGGVYSNGSISGDQIKLKIDGETLYMSYNGGVTWMKVGSVGSPAVEPPKYTASVASVSSGTTADASVNVVNNDFKFTFSLPRGADGKDGTPGTPGESEFKSFIFTRSEKQPATPGDDQGSYSDPVPTITDSNGVRIWHDTIPDGWLPVWVSTRNFNINGPKSSWSTPRQMVDTSDFIVVYGDANVTKIDITQPEYSLNKFYEGDANQAEAKWLEDINKKLGHTGWRDTAEESTGAVYMASCKLSGGVWSSWSINKIKGEKGDNGGYDYVFKLTEENKAPNPPKTSQEDYYQLEDEWYQYPQTVTELMEYQWVSTRHKVNNEWSAYSPPVLYNSYATEGIAPSATFKSFAFCRTNNVWSATDGRPTGGTYEKAWPTSGKIGGKSVTWSDTIPTGNGAIWMTTAVFDSKKNTESSPEWSIPIQWSDTANLQIEYSAETTYTKLENLQKYYDEFPNEFEEKWREKNKGWGDDVPNAIWMAVATMSNGIWSDWTVYKIKGEDGTDGTSFNLIGNYKIYEDLIEAEYKKPHVLGDAYTVNFINVDVNENFIKPEYNEINGKIQWVDSTKTDPSKSGINNVLFIYDGDTWEYCGKFGGSEFIHIKYAEVVESGGFEVTIDGAKKKLQFTDSEGETPGDYIGIYTDNNSDDPTDGSLYKWSKWTGNDGWGYQYIYKLSKTNKPFEEDESGRPLLPSRDPEKMDDIPEGWSDDPIDVTEEFPYCWMCYSQSDENGGWSDWKGTYENKPALWAKWGVDGAPGESGAGYQQCFMLSDEKKTKFDEHELPDGDDLKLWTTSAQGVSSSKPVEWRCDRVKLEGSDTWSDWSAPHVFSHFGKNGEDGAGLEYVFLLVDSDVPVEAIKEITKISIDSEDYQNDDHEPTTNYNLHGRNYQCKWTDNQSTVTAEKPFLYSSIRRKKKGQWQAFEEPVLWNQYVTNGLDGQMSLSIKVWRRSATTSVDFPRPGAATFNLLTNTLTFDKNNGWAFNDMPKHANNSVLWSCIAYVTGTVTNNEVKILADDWRGPNIESVDGQDGSGQSAVYLTVDPDYVLVNVDDSGKARFDQTITGYANYYYGSEVQSAKLTFASTNAAIAVTSTNVQDDGTSNSFKITIPEGTSINNHEYITIHSTPKDTSKTINGETIVFSELQSIISINKIASNDVYSLIVTPNQIVVPSNNKSWGTTITCTALKNGSADSNATIKSLNDKVTLTRINSGTYECQINNDTFDDLPSELTFVLEVDGKSIAHQTVSLIKQYVVSFTSFVFKWFSQDDEIKKPTGGSFYKPTPEESEGWSDNPTAKDSDNILYMSWCKFSSDTPDKAEWSKPVIAQDTDLIDFKYSVLTTDPGNPDDNTNNWNELPDNAVWMAVRKKLLGKWQPWKIFRIKGEKGDPGVNGASITEVHEYYAWTDTTDTPNITESDITTNPWEDITIDNVTWSHAKPATFDPTKPYLWNIEVIVINGTSDSGQAITDYKITEPALISASGKGIAKIEEMYLLSNNASGVTNTSSGWDSYDKTKHIPTEKSPYLWNYEKITYTDESEESTPAVIIAVWNKGDKGDDGRSIGEIFEYYLYTESETVPDINWDAFQLSWNENGIEVVSGLKNTDGTSWWLNRLPTTVKNCLWNVEVIAYKDSGDGYTHTSCILLSNRANEIKSIEEYYMISQKKSGVTVTDNDVLTYPQTGVFVAEKWYRVASNQQAPVPTYTAPYLWNTEKITYNSGYSEFKSPTRIGALIKGDSGDPSFSRSVELSEDMYSVILDKDTRCPNDKYVFFQEVELFENGTPVSSTVEWKVPEGITIVGPEIVSNTRKKYQITIPNTCKFEQNSLTLSWICKTSSGLQASKNCTIIALLETNRYSLHCTPARLIKKYNNKFVGDNTIQCAVYDDFTGTPVKGVIPSGYSLLYTYDDKTYQTVTNGTITAEANYNWCKVYLVRGADATKVDAELIRDYVLVEISTLPKPEINYTVTPNEIVYDVQNGNIVGGKEFSLNHTFLYDGAIVKPSDVKIGYYDENNEFKIEKDNTGKEILSVSGVSAYEFTLKITNTNGPARNSYFVQATYEKDGDSFVAVYPIQINVHVINFVVHAMFDTVNLGKRISRPEGITSETRSVNLGTIGIQAYYDDEFVDYYTLEYTDSDGYVKVASTGAAYSTPKLYYEQYYNECIGDKTDLLQEYLDKRKDTITFAVHYQNASAGITLHLTSQENNALYHWVGVSSIGHKKQNYNIVGHLGEIGGDEFITEDDLERLNLSVKFFVDNKEVAKDKDINLTKLASTGYDGKQLGVLKEFSIRVYDQSGSIVFVENITRLDTPSDPFEAVPATICVDNGWSTDLTDKISIDGIDHPVTYYVNDVSQDGNTITIDKSSGGDVITLKAEVLESEESENVIYTYSTQTSTYVNGAKGDPGVGITAITSGKDGSIDITTTDNNTESIAIPTQNSLTLYKRSKNKPQQQDFPNVIRWHYDRANKEWTGNITNNWSRTLPTRNGNPCYSLTYEWVGVPSDIINISPTDWSQLITVSESTDGQPGATGAIIYPAGEWSSKKEYIVTGSTAPYVKYEGVFYVATKTPDDTLTPDKSNCWITLDKFDAIYTDILFAGKGQVGAVLFNGNWMYSQEGTNVGQFKGSYTNIQDILNPTDQNEISIPNFAINCLTGEGYFSQGAFRWDSAGNIMTSGNMKALGDDVLYSGTMQALDGQTHVYKVYDLTKLVVANRLTTWETTLHMTAIIPEKLDSLFDVGKSYSCTAYLGDELDIYPTPMWETEQSMGASLHEIVFTRKEGFSEIDINGKTFKYLNGTIVIY